MTDTAVMPVRLIAGDSLVMRLPAAAIDYPSSDGWTVALALSPIAGGTAITVNAVAEVDAWVVTLTTAAAAALAIGRFGWAIRAAKTGLRETIMTGELLVSADPALANTDRRSHARRVLDAVEAAIEGRASSADLEYVFEDGRSVKMMGHDELVKLRSAYRREVAREERTSGARRPMRIVARL